MLGRDKQLVVQRIREKSLQLQILVLDRQTQSIMNTIHCMQFGGVTKDDVNYRILALSEDKILLFYPNGLVCVYENVLAQARLKNVIESEYGNLFGPQISQENLVALSLDLMAIILFPLATFETDIASKNYVKTDGKNV